MKNRPTNESAPGSQPSPKGKEHNIESVTASYEAWMRSCANILQSDLRSKHEQMKETTFGFLRGTFYRWAELWPSVCSDLCSAPKVLAVGDLHVNSFGTWRDAEGMVHCLPRGSTIEENPASPVKVDSLSARSTHPWPPLGRPDSAYYTSQPQSSFQHSLWIFLDRLQFAVNGSVIKIAESQQE